MEKRKILLNEFRQITTEAEGECFIKKYHQVQEFHNFHEFLKHKADANSVPMSQIVTYSRLNRNYVYNITSGKKNPSRDKIIALCLAAELGFDDVNQALTLGEKPPLNPYEARDVWLAVCINSKVRDVLKVNLFLSEKECIPLSI